MTLHYLMLDGVYRQQLEHLCRYLTRPAVANERLKRNVPAKSCCN